MLWPSHISWNSLLVFFSNSHSFTGWWKRISKCGTERDSKCRQWLRGVSYSDVLKFWNPGIVNSSLSLGVLSCVGWGKASKVSLRLQSIFGRGTCGSKVHGPRHWKTRPLIHYSQSWPDPVQSVTVRRIIIGKNTERIWSFAAWRRKLTRAIYRRWLGVFQMTHCQSIPQPQLLAFLPPRIVVKNPQTNEVMVMSCDGPISLQRRHLTLLPSNCNLWKCLPITLGESRNKL